MVVPDPDQHQNRKPDTGPDQHENLTIHNAAFSHRIEIHVSLQESCSIDKNRVCMDDITKRLQF
jgi:hypothetical protein